jgi:hypothetical protein
MPSGSSCDQAGKMLFQNLSRIGCLRSGIPEAADVYRTRADMLLR